MLHFLFELSGIDADSLAMVVVRDVLAALTALAVAIVFGERFVRFQQRRRALERTVRGDSAQLDELHRAKSSTPTMGGVIFLVGIVMSTLCWASPGSRAVWMLLGVTVALAALGFVDDQLKLSGRRSGGVPARLKLASQVALGLCVGLWLFLDPLTVDAALGSALVLPVVKTAVPLGVLSIAFVALVTAGASNAVNLTDGLDGLAIGCAILTGVPLAIAALLCGDATLAGRFAMAHVPEGAEISVFASALVGAGLGFLRFNRHPARIFMGDTGALALGGALGLIAVLTKKELFLLVAGGVFVVETLSVILQVASFKLRGKRIFLIAPLHHHFQFKGLREAEVTRRFWAAGAILALFAVVTLGLW